METKPIARFDAKLPKAQKEYFEYAASLGGYRTLTDFVIQSVQEKADQVIEKHKSWLTTKRDQEIFFNALTNPPKPNKALKDLAKLYKKMNARQASKK